MSTLDSANMKTIGLLGGMSWESTLGYYQAINQGVKARLGGLHSAKIAMVSVDFAPIEALQQAGNWKSSAERLIEAANQIEAADADCLLICTNTMHKVADQVEAAIQIPLLHIADATAQQLIDDGISQVGLLGTAFTMEQDFYKQRLKDKFGLQVQVPAQQDRDIVHQVIYEELCLGICKQESKREYLRIIEQLAKGGAQAVILGCTEIAMLIQQADTEVTLIDTTAIHAERAVQFALDGIC
jgi:aspartate racemase